MTFHWIRSFLPGDRGVQDGEGLNLAAAAPEALDIAQTFAREAEGARRDGLRRDTIAAHLSVKVLGAHLANRYQTSYPLTLHLGSLSPGESEAVMRLLADAVVADGHEAPERVAEIAAQLSHLGASTAQIEMLRTALAVPSSSNARIAAVLAADKGPHVYALALLCGVARSPAGSAYLAFLALRLGLSRETVGSLSRRFRG